jgi:hypothetical protein
VQSFKDKDSVSLQVNQSLAQTGSLYFLLVYERARHYCVTANQ